jgi:hypothetical protein
MKTIPDPPPRLSTFKRRGGVRNPICSFRRPRSRRPDQRRSCSPALLSCPVLNQCGPSSRHFIFPSAFPLLPCVIHSPLLFGPRGLTFFSPSTHYLPRVPFLSTSASHPKASSFLRLLPFHLMSSAMNRPLSSFSHLVTLPRPYNPAPPFLSCTILRAGLHAHPSSYSVIPGGSARSLPYPEVLSWRAVLNPKKQLLKRLVVVRHRLRHNGEVLP